MLLVKTRCLGQTTEGIEEQKDKWVVFLFMSFFEKAKKVVMKIFF